MRTIYGFIHENIITIMMNTLGTIKKSATEAVSVADSNGIILCVQSIYHGWLGTVAAFNVDWLHAAMADFFISNR